MTPQQAKANLFNEIKALTAQLDNLKSLNAFEYRDKVSKLEHKLETLKVVYAELYN